SRRAWPRRRTPDAERCSDPARGGTARGACRSVVMTAPLVWLPYCGPGPTPAEWLGRWNLDPLLLAGLGAAGVLWLLLGGLRAAPRRRLYFAAGMGLLVVALVSPLCALASALFSARVAHHAV